MLYTFLQIVMPLVLRVYYRKITVSGREHVPATGPCLLACNHPNSFLDAIMVGAFSPRRLHFLTRSDVFNAPWKKWLLSKMNMVPIYRMRDGLDNLDKNQETFEKCREVFRAGGVILIFSEGLCVQELKLRPLKKGTARIALDFIQDGTPLTVVPVGLNYLYPMKFRKEVFFGFAPALHALDFRAAYQENAAKGILSFNRKLETLLRSQVIHLEDSKWEGVIKHLFETALNTRLHTLEQLVAMSQQFNKLLKKNPEAVQLLRNQHEHYTRLLTESRLEDATVVRSGLSLLGPLNFILLLPGFLLSYIPFSAIRLLARKKVKLVEFYDSVLTAGGMIFSLLFAILAAVIIASIFDAWYVLTIPLIIYLTAMLSVPAYDRLKEFAQSMRFRKLNMANQQKLRDARLEMLKFVEVNLSPDSIPSSSPPI